MSRRARAVDRLRGRFDAAVRRRAEAVVAAAEERAVERARDGRLLEPRVWGPSGRLRISASAEVANAYLNTTSGEIEIHDHVRLEHDVAVLAEGHAVDAFDGPRAPLDAGHDVVIARGALVGARSVLVGPCRIGPYAVVTPGSVVSGDVPAGAVMAGNPAIVVRRLGVSGGLPPSLEADTDVGRLRMLLGDEVITPALQRDGVWEPEHATAVRARLRPGMTVVDVGANIGYTALVAAAAVSPGGRVIAVEPHPENVALLRHNVEGAAVEVVAAAAWREPGTVALAISPSNAGDHRTEALGSERDTVEVPAVRLDDVIGDRRIDLIKLDCQGCEHVVLEGAAAVIGRDRPAILTEFWPVGIRQLGDDPAAVLRAYRRLGYRLGVLEAPALGESPTDAAILAAVEARPDPVGGFATLVLTPEHGTSRFTRDAATTRAGR